MGTAGKSASGGRLPYPISMPLPDGDFYIVERVPQLERSGRDFRWDTLRGGGLLGFYVRLPHVAPWRLQPGRSRTSDSSTAYYVVIRPPSSVHVDGGNGSAVVDADSAPPQLLFGIPWRAPAPHSYAPLCRGPRRMKPPNLRLRSPFCRLSCSGALLGSRSTIRSIIVGRT